MSAAELVMHEIVRHLKGDINQRELFELVKKQDPSMQLTEDFATSWGVKLGMLSQYMLHRGAAGCGDGGHDKALDRAGKAVSKYRKAFGYTLP